MGKINLTIRGERGIRAKIGLSSPSYKERLKFRKNKIQLNIVSLYFFRTLRPVYTQTSVYVLLSVWGVTDCNCQNIRCQVCIVKGKYITGWLFCLLKLLCKGLSASKEFNLPRGTFPFILCLMSSKFLNATDLLGGVYEVW